MRLPSDTNQKAFDDVDTLVAPFDLIRTQSRILTEKESPGIAFDAVVKIFTTAVERNYLTPWQIRPQKTWHGSGFAVSGRRIVTNAHVVKDAAMLQVTKDGIPTKYRARATCIAHDLDLAIVHVEDDEFWEGLATASLTTELPELFSEVRTVGFPTGGDRSTAFG